MKEIVVRMTTRNPNAIFLKPKGKRKLIDPPEGEKKMACTRERPIIIYVETTFVVFLVLRLLKTFGTTWSLLPHTSMASLIESIYSGSTKSRFSMNFWRSKYVESMMKASKALGMMLRAVEYLNRANREINVAFTQVVEEEGRHCEKVAMDKEAKLQWSNANKEVKKAHVEAQRQKDIATKSATETWKASEVEVHKFRSSREKANEVLTQFDLCLVESEGLVDLCKHNIVYDVQGCLAQWT
ncbi:hypothetical protein V6N13_059618 [Hibiscus sabdariffa]